jgi:hypothetical protein
MRVKRLHLVSQRLGVLLGTLAIGLLFPSESLLAQCGTVTRSRVTSYNTPVIVRKEVIEVVPAIVPFFTPVFVPAYGAGYNPAYLGGIPPVQAQGVPPVQVGVPPVQGVGQQPIIDANQRAQQVDNATLLREIQKLNQRLDTIERRVGGNPQAVPMDRSKEGDSQVSLKLPKALVPKCAACHSTTAEKEGGGFAFLSTTGLTRKLSDTELRKIAKKVKSGAMPPADNKKGIAALTQEEGNELLDWVEDQ